MRALDKRVSFAATDAELSGLKGLRPQFTKEKAGRQVLRELDRAADRARAPVTADPRIRVAVKTVAARANGRATSAR